MFQQSSKKIETDLKKVYKTKKSKIEIQKLKLKMANTLSVMTNVLRNVVSKQRIRYKEKGFNLDLACKYIYIFYLNFYK